MYNKKFNPMMLLVLISLLFTQQSLANEHAIKLDKEVDLAIKKFETDIEGGAKFLSQVKGYLVIPSVIKAGFIIGGEYGTGSLRINGETRHYYSLTAASVGYQIGAQEHSVLIAFLSEASLQNFMKSNGWEAGVDGTVAVAEWGKGGDISSISYEKPIVAFMYGSKGLMAGATVKGTKFKRIIPQ
jgi:lipid-binding SYLF domain-containing protein